MLHEVLVPATPIGVQPSAPSARFVALSGWQAALVKRGKTRGTSAAQTERLIAAAHAAGTLIPVGAPPGQCGGGPGDVATQESSGGQADAAQDDGEQSWPSAESSLPPPTMSLAELAPLIKYVERMMQLAPRPLNSQSQSSRPHPLPL